MGRRVPRYHTMHIAPLTTMDPGGPATADQQALANGHGDVPVEIRERLLEMDVATMTPLEALNALADLQRRLE
jgi:DNA mismatch repair protein MutS